MLKMFKAIGYSLDCEEELGYNIKMYKVGKDDNWIVVNDMGEVLTRQFKWTKFATKGDHIYKHGIAHDLAIKMFFIECKRLDINSVFRDEDE